MSKSRFALCSLLLSAALLALPVIRSADAATAEDVKKQQEQIRDRAKEIDDKAQAEKQAREREEARKAQELRDKQSREENPTNPLPRSTVIDPSRQPIRPSGNAMTPPYPRTASPTLAQLEAEMLALAQRVQRLEQLLAAQGHTITPPATGPKRPGDGQSESGNRNRTTEEQTRNQLQAQANEREWAEMRKAQDQRNSENAGAGFITPSVVADYYLGPKEPPLRR